MYDVERGIFVPELNDLIISHDFEFVKGKMPNKVNDKIFKCSICGESFPLESLAIGCETKHDTVLVPIPRSDLHALMQFFRTKDDDLISPTLQKIISKYSRYNKR